MKRYEEIASDGGSNILGQVLEQRERLRTRLASVRRTVAVASGKGGVGKSFVTAGLGAALAGAGTRVGILDADVNGASIPGMAGLSGRRAGTPGADGVPPLRAGDVRVMSIELFLEDGRSPVLWEAPTQTDAYTWRSMMEMGAIREFLSDTDWGELDYLLIDLPPGTDKLANLADLLPDLSGLVLVTIPSAVAGRVVARSIRMAKRAPRIPILGLVENMATQVCAHCGREEILVPGGGIERLAAEEGVPYLGRIPFDPHLARAADAGTLLTEWDPASRAGSAVGRLAQTLRSVLEGDAP